jgi:chain length determinant protein tyrosine kinase EpsG
MNMGELGFPARERDPFDGGERTIGALLVRAGALTPAGVERILEAQHRSGRRFGESGLELGLLEQRDVDFALSRQFAYPYLRRGESRVSESLVAAYDPASPQVEALRALRSELMLHWFGDDAARKSLAVVSEARGEGRSYIAASLAVVLAQLGGRTLLIDADLRNPSQHRLFGLDNRVGFSGLLSGRAGAEAVQRVPGLDSLSVLPSGATPPNPQELLARPSLGVLLEQISAHLDFIVFDTPPAAESADAQTVAVRARAALFVARKNHSRLWRLQAIAQSVARAHTTVLGAVLNDF